MGSGVEEARKTLDLEGRVRTLAPQLLRKILGP